MLICMVSGADCAEQGALKQPFAVIILCGWPLQPFLLALATANLKSAALVRAKGLTTANTKKQRRISKTHFMMRVFVNRQGFRLASKDRLLQDFTESTSGHLGQLALF